ncbi:MAG: isoprenylcysteine carboxylmethyltransferase family protein [Thermodesulfobacteriota bacterium]
MKSKIRPPTYFFLSLLVMTGLHFIVPVIRVVPAPFNLFGLLLIIAGIGLNIWAWRLFQKAETPECPTERPTRLILEGPFRFTRNPMYLGMLLSLAGLAVLLGTLTPWLVPPLFILKINRFVSFEENVMAEVFGTSYLSYRKSIHRWI